MVEKLQTPKMFSAIARRYDLLNHALSLNVDRKWRRVLVDMSDAAEGASVLDVATGTGDVAIEFARRSRAGTIVGVDRSGAMLEVANDKLEKERLSQRVRLMECDALELPFATGTFDVVTIAFGLRNLADYALGIREMARLLKPGGRLLILEFFPPRTGLFFKAYRFYLATVLPVAGRLISGSEEAYRYLAASIKDFASHDDFRRFTETAGLDGVYSRKLTGGIAYIYRGIKP
jgi:demethylmenaquinone methyltransferase/2-methoxy-6-polyprenyl-1,4-benzoquinol methylase